MSLTASLAAEGLSVYDAYPAEDASGALIGVLMSFQLGLRQFDQVTAVIRRFYKNPSIRVEWTDPISPIDNVFREAARDIDGLSGVLSRYRERLPAIWDEVTRESPKLFVSPDVMGVSLGARDGELLVVVYVLSRLFRPREMQPIPESLAGLPVEQRVGVFQPCTLRDRAFIDQRIQFNKDEENSLVGTQFSLGGLFTHQNKPTPTYALSCAHAMVLDVNRLHSPSPSIPVFKVEQVEGRCRTVSRHKIDASCQPIKNIVMKHVSETLFPSMEELGRVVHLELANLDASGSRISDEKGIDSTSAVPNSVCSLSGVDVSLIRLHSNSTLLCRGTGQRFSGRMQQAGDEEEWGTNCTVYGSRQTISGVLTHVHYRLTGDDGWVSRSSMMDTQHPGLVLWNQCALVIEQFTSTYFSTDPHGNSGAWFFSDVTGNALAVLSSITSMCQGGIVAGCPMPRIVQWIKRKLPDFADWDGSYLPPIREREQPESDTNCTVF